MELKMTQEELSVWSCSEPLEKQSLISAESVVPDTLPDIGRIVWTQGGLLLKGKELRPEGVSVSGEVWASVLYLTEGLDALESLRLTKPFRMDFENARPDAEATPAQLTSVKSAVVPIVAIAVCARVRTARISAAMAPATALAPE